MIIARKVTEDNWNLDEIMKALAEELTARERTAKDMSGSTSKPPKNPNSTFHTRTIACIYCNHSGHVPEACRTVTSIDARKQMIREAKRCFVCLKTGHLGRDCWAKSRCSQCHGKHHTSICYKSKSPAESKQQEPVASSAGTLASSRLNPSAPAFDSSSTPTMLTDSRQTALLQTACALAFNPQIPARQTELRFIFDSGSQRSYITDQACKALALTARGVKTMSIMTFGSTKQRNHTCKEVKLGVQTKGGGTLELILYTVPFISEALETVLLQSVTERYMHLRELDLADSSTVRCSREPDILVGADQYWDILTGETRRGVEGPVASYSKLGWVLSGPFSYTASMSLLVTHCLAIGARSVGETVALDKQLREFWELESLGILEREEVVYEQFHKNVQFLNGRYQVSLPWRDSVLAIPDNHHLSLRRLQGLLRRLRGSPSILKEYDGIIRDQLERGIVEVVDDPAQMDGGRLHYLPHHAVIRHEKETTKLRVVFDASARGEGQSLNDCLHVGPKFHQKIFEILVRFRSYRYAFIADIEKAFLMISVAPSDRDVLRFLWVRSIEEQVPQIIILRYTRVVFGVACSPFLLNATVTIM